MSLNDSEALDQADMAQLMAGHDLALNALMDRHAGSIFRFLCRFVRDEETANDLAQETFVRVYQKRARFKLGMRFTTWLFTIAGNLARNHLRACSRRPESAGRSDVEEGQGSAVDGMPREDFSPDELAVQTEQRRAVRKAVSELPNDLREAVVLCELEDRTVAEAAEILGTTVKAVESRLYRARHQLRSQLTRWLAAG